MITWGAIIGFQLTFNGVADKLDGIIKAERITNTAEYFAVLRAGGSVNTWSAK